MARRTPRPEWTADQKADADRIRAALLEAAGDLRDDATLFGATASAVRDLVRGIGAKAVPAAVVDRAKK